MNLPKPPGARRCGRTTTNSVSMPRRSAPAPRARPSAKRRRRWSKQFRPPVVSFHFGLPPAPLLERVRRSGAFVLSSATTVDEARWLEAHGVDAVIAQGLEAGGHRGHFLSDELSRQLGTFALLPQIKRAVRVPVIAAGGIADAEGVAAAMALGADGVQIGTAYLLCPEATTSAVHRAALQTRSSSAHRIDQPVHRPAGARHRQPRDARAGPAACGAASGLSARHRGAGAAARGGRSTRQRRLFAAVVGTEQHRLQGCSRRRTDAGPVPWFPRTRSMSDFLKYEQDGAIVTLTMNAPEVRNALTGNAAVDEFVAAVERINADPTVRVMILTGAGTVFSSGGNVKDMKRFTTDAVTPAEIGQWYRNGIQRLPLALQKLEVPSIAAVNGPAVGAGNDLACMCDMRIASTNASFAESFIRVGLIPGDGGAWLLPRVVGLSKAMEMSFTGDAVKAEEALAIGLVSRVVAPEALMAEANALAARIARNPGQTLRLTKRLLREGQHQRLDSLLELSAALQVIAHKTPAHAEAVNAFIDKREPKFGDV